MTMKLLSVPLFWTPGDGWESLSSAEYESKMNRFTQEFATSQVYGLQVLDDLLNDGFKEWQSFTESTWRPRWDVNATYRVVILRKNGRKPYRKTDPGEDPEESE